jgi:hypothetical protein
MPADTSTCLQAPFIITIVNVSCRKTWSDQSFGHGVCSLGMKHVPCLTESADHLLRVAWLWS